jgi:hypothetical protein
MAQVPNPCVRELASKLWNGDAQPEVGVRISRKQQGVFVNTLPNMLNDSSVREETFEQIITGAMIYCF